MFGFGKKKANTNIAEVKEVHLSAEEIAEVKKEIEELNQSNQFQDEKFYERRGLLYERIKDEDAAIENFEKSLEIKPAVGEGYKKLMSLYNAKRSTSAKQGDGEGIDYYMNKMDELRQIARKHSIG